MVEYDISYIQKLMEGFRILHVVPLFRYRRVFQKRCLPDCPKGAHLKQWIRTAVPLPGPPAAGSQPVESKWGGPNVYQVMSWMDASRYISQQKEIMNARAAFGKLELSLRSTLTKLYVTKPGQYKQRQPWNPDSLRCARVKLDAMCMLLLRIFLAAVLGLNSFIYIFVDASPQWRGLELFAASFDIVVIGEYRYVQRRLFPQISIGPFLYTVSGKCCALLWQIWLVSGPTFSSIRLFCNRIRGFCCDLGTEHRIVECPDILPEFMHYIGCKVPSSYKRQNFLFPSALLVSGWHHVMDGIIRYGLCSLPWFDGFLAKLKSCLRFFSEPR